MLEAHGICAAAQTCKDFCQLAEEVGSVRWMRLLRNDFPEEALQMNGAIVQLLGQQFDCCASSGSGGGSSTLTRIRSSSFARSCWAAEGEHEQEENAEDVGGVEAAREMKRIYRVVVNSRAEERRARVQALQNAQSNQTGGGGLLLAAVAAC